jgi:hypothetical protein
LTEETVSARTAEDVSLQQITDAHRGNASTKLHAEEKVGS